MKKFIKFLVTSTLLIASLSSNAGIITVWGEERSGFSLNSINDFYNGLSGFSSSIANGTLDLVDLSNTDLLWATHPSNAYTASELEAMADYLALGGRIAFMGEHGSWAPSENLRINDALSYLGSSIVINNTTVDGGWRSASVGDGQILSHEMTGGVSSYEYAAFAPLTIGSDAVALMLGEELYNNDASIMMAFQNIGAGSVFLITDQNVWDNSSDWGAADNAKMFENLVNANTGVSAPKTDIPEPNSLVLLSIALFGFMRKIKK